MILLEIRNVITPYHMLHFGAVFGLIILLWVYMEFC